MLGKHPEEVLANAIHKTEASHEFNLHDHIPPIFLEYSINNGKISLKKLKTRGLVSS